MNIKDKLLLIDFDSTFVAIESLDQLADIALDGKKDKEKILKEIVAITKMGMEGKITFPQSLAIRLKLFQPNKKHIAKLITILHNSITPSIKKQKAFFKKNADTIYILSGGFVEYMIPVLQEFGIAADHVLGNTLLFDKRGNVAGYDIKNPLAWEKGKVKKIQQMKFKKRPYMLGDGFTDYEIKEAGLVEKFIAFTENIARDTVVQRADYAAKNFKEVLQLL